MLYHSPGSGTEYIRKNISIKYINIFKIKVTIKFIKYHLRWCQLIYLYRRISSILILALIMASLIQIILPTSSDTATLNSGVISINQAPIQVSNISIVSFSIVTQLLSDYRGQYNEYNALDAWGDLIAATGRVIVKTANGDNVSSSHVAFYDSNANHIATYRVDTTYNGIVTGSRGTDIEVLNGKEAVVVGSVDYEREPILFIYIIGTTGSLLCSKAYMIPGVSMIKDTPRVEVHPSGELYVSGSGYEADRPASFIIVFDKTCTPIKSMIYYYLDLRDIAVEEAKGKYIAVTGRYVPEDALYLGIVDQDSLLIKGFRYPLSGGSTSIGLDVDVNETFIAVAGQVANRTASGVNVDYNGLVAGFSYNLSNLWATELGSQDKTTIETFLGVDIIEDKVLAAGSFRYTDLEGLIYEVDKNTGYPVARPTLYFDSGTSNKSLKDVDHIYIKGELRKLFAGNYTADYLSYLRSVFMTGMTQYHYNLAMVDTRIEYRELKPSPLDVKFTSYQLVPVINGTIQSNNTDEVLLVINQSVTDSIPRNPVCKNGLSPVIDLSTGTGQPFTAHPPGVSSDPVNDYPDWELVNATGPHLSQPVTVVPHPAWYNTFPQGSRASWISVYASSSGTPSGFGDAWYRINFTMPSNGYIELWFTGDDYVYLYLDNTQIASSSSFTTLTHIIVPVSQGQHTLYAFVDDVAATVSGFIVYGWACAVPCETTTVTITTTITDTITRTITETITETSTITETVTKTENVTTTKTVYNTTTTTTTITETTTVTTTDTTTVTETSTVTDTITSTVTDTVTRTTTTTVTETSVTCCPPSNITITQQGGQQSNIIVILLGIIIVILLIILFIVLLRRI